MPRQITWSYHTETGSTNTSFNTKMINPALNFLGNYWDINFVWVPTNGRIKYILARSPNPTWAAWTNGMVCRINAAYNFAVGPTSNLFCAHITMHEFGHMCGGGSHSSVPGLMSTNANVQNGNLSPSDYRWFDVYPRKPGSKRPHEEPNRLRNAFYTPTNNVMAVEETPEAEFGCHVMKRPWYDIRPASWLRP